MKKYFFTGFVTLLPLALTIIIAVWLFNLFTAPLAGIMEMVILHFEKKLGLTPEHYASLVFLLSRILALALLLLIIFLLGICGQKLMLNLFQKFPEKLFARIPFIRSIFRLSKEVTDAVFAENTKTFKQTVLLPFPHSDALSIGFVTGNTPPILKGTKFETDFVIFLPTAPHPISGYVLLAPKKIVYPIDVSVEDAFKFLISCGVINPEDSPSPQK